MTQAPRRKSLRLQTFDHTDPDPYFVTTCLNTRESRFGQIRDGRMILNDVGKVVPCEWLSLPHRFPSVILDAFVLMPDHLHGILVLHEGDAGYLVVSLGDVMKAFKSITTNAYIHGVRQSGWPPFERRLWQYNSYEHIIRSDRDLESTRASIDGNPGRWRDTVS